MQVSADLIHTQSHSSTLIHSLILHALPLRHSLGGRRSPAVACWASDHLVASSNPLRGKFRH